MSDVKKDAIKTVNLPEGFSEIKLDRTVYKPETCGGMPLIGWMLALLDMPEGDAGNGPWQAIVVKTTAPTKSVDRDNNVIDTKVGEEVLIPATTKLKQAFSQAAAVPDKVFQIFIQPTHKVKLDGGRNMWNYKVAVHKDSRPRTGEFAIVSGSATSSNQLNASPQATA